MKVYIVRHAHAGDRSAWGGDDRLRPLSHVGTRQAEVIAKELASTGVERLVSSPSVRCLETLRPLADTSGVPLDSDVRLAEGSGEAACVLLEELRVAAVPAAVCSHGDVVAALLGGLRRRGVPFPDGVTWPKASIWVVDGDDGGWSAARFVAPPVV